MTPSLTNCGEVRSGVIPVPLAQPRYKHAHALAAEDVDHLFGDRDLAEGGRVDVVGDQDVAAAEGA
jgi:hypothetical protein